MHHSRSITSSLIIPVLCSQWFGFSPQCSSVAMCPCFNCACVMLTTMWMTLIAWMTSLKHALPHATQLLMTCYFYFSEWCLYKYICSQKRLGNTQFNIFAYVLRSWPLHDRHVPRGVEGGRTNPHFLKRVVYPVAWRGTSRTCTYGYSYS